jgi:hypothetical protein
MEPHVIQTEILMGRKQTAEYLGHICLTTLDRLNLPRVKVRRRVLYRKSTLDAWLSTHEDVRRLNHDS